MSLSGIVTFERNVRTLMDSEAFRSASDAERLGLGYRLMNSKYGLGSVFGSGPVKPLPERKCCESCGAPR